VADVGLRGVGNTGQQIGPRQQLVDLRGIERQVARLRGHEAVLHRMGHANAHVKTDDPGGAFERMSGTHADLELVGLSVIALEREQARRQDEGLGLDLLAEQIEHRELAQIWSAHARLRRSA
jgi:hypothetical protein